MMAMNSLMVLALTLGVALGCICPIAKFSNQFQNADIVANVKITGRTTTNGSAVYTVNYVKVFKPTNGNAPSVNTISTDASILGCGSPSLFLNDSYLVAITQNSTNTLTLNKCDQFPVVDNTIPLGPQLWSVVSLSLKNQLAAGFAATTATSTTASTTRAAAGAAGPGNNTH